MVTKATFVGPGFTRKPPKYERFIRPTGLRFTKAHVTHPELKCTFNLEIIGVKKNPNGPTYTSLGVITKGTIIEVNPSSPPPSKYQFISVSLLYSYISCLALPDHLFLIISNFR
jgi:ribosomal protein S8E